MKKSRVYLAAVVASAALLLAGCPTVKGPPSPRALGSAPKYLTLTLTMTPTITETPVPMAPVPTNTWALTWTHSQTLTPDPATPVPGLPPTFTPTPDASDNCPGIHLGTLDGGGITLLHNSFAATDSQVGNNCTGDYGNDYDQFYSFTVDVTSLVEINVQYNSGTDYDTTVALGTSCGAQDITCRDGDDITRVLTPGTYWILIESYDEYDNGNWELTIDKL